MADPYQPTLDPRGIASAAVEICDLAMERASNDPGTAMSIICDAALRFARGAGVPDDTPARMIEVIADGNPRPSDAEKGR